MTTSPAPATAAKHAVRYAAKPAEQLDIPDPADEVVDVVLVGAGIMSATLATLIAQLEPSWSIRIYERLGDVALESTNAWNNAGTGHAAYCELNYTSERADGSVRTDRALKINHQFGVTRELWSYLEDRGILDQSQWLTTMPHLTFVTGAGPVDYLRRRWTALAAADPAFADMEFTDDPEVISQWAPLLMDHRPRRDDSASPARPVAASRMAHGTDIDFGALTHQMVDGLRKHGARVFLEHVVTDLKRVGKVTRNKPGVPQQFDASGARWSVTVRDASSQKTSSVRARFVFVGAGGGALPLLQASGIEEIRGYGGFPVSGIFLRTSNPDLIARHEAKVYGKAAIGAPPMSVPHLDTRVVGGKKYLMFGPFAGFSPRFLKYGLPLGLIQQLRPHNIRTLLRSGWDNRDLVIYLIKEVMAGPTKRLEALRAFVPTARSRDWEKIVAGQRVQIMKVGPQGQGMMELGTEVVAAADGSIAGLLGASPGASTVAATMTSVLQTCFPERQELWKNKLAEMMPSL